MNRTCALVGMLLLLEAAPGCATRTSVRAPGAAAAADPLDRLRADLDRLFDDVNFAQAQWGVEVVSLDRGDLLYARNPAKLYMPASNNKVLTSAAALVRLGPDFKWETRLLAEGSVGGGVLTGNLWIAGSGDPALAPRFSGGDPFGTFRLWAARLKEKGVGRIEGGLVGDDRAFEETELGAGWEWDDLGYGYAAPVSALQFNENLVSIEIAPAGAPGEPAGVKQSPLPGYLEIDNRVVTGPAGSESELEVDSAGSGESVRLRGSVPAGAGAVTRTLAVRRPTRYFLEALKQALSTEGVPCSPCGLAPAPRASAPPVLFPLFVHSSPALGDILKPLLKVSQNLYAETVTRTLGLSLRGEGSFAKGKEVVEDVLRNMAVEKGTYFYADGSGLSRRNLVSADVMVRVLKYMHRHKHASVFYASLPIGGVDGTIAGRMKGTRAENNVRAKTGSIAYVRSLSGYVKTADGENLVFSMIANNFLTSSRTAEYAQDAALERLVGFARR